MTPYANYRFKVRWGGGYVLGCSRVSGLSRSTEVIRHREGGDPSPVRVTPGQTEYAPIVLERGVSYDVTFQQWANKVFDHTNAAAAGNPSPPDFRKDLTIEVFNEAGQKVLAYNVFRAWVSELRAGSELDGIGNALVVESITLQNEGWIRDPSVDAPAEPSFVPPGEDPPR